jgi:tetratricopeptide (TPR) repeat protein
MENLAPDSFRLWQPPIGRVIEVGADNLRITLPDVPLPLPRTAPAGDCPTAAEIGQGLYDYLRQFPDCEGNTIYAGLLAAAFPHFLSDLAAHAVMLDAKDVEPAYVLRKLTCLKILRLVDPMNAGLLRQLCLGYFELALDFAELADCRRHLLEAMRFGQELLKVAAEDSQALTLLAEIDGLFGDTPAAIDKLRRLLDEVADDALSAQVKARIAALQQRGYTEITLVDELESVAAAMVLHQSGDHLEAVALLERIDEQGLLPRELPSANFYCLLAYCRQGCGDPGGAMVALQRALEIEPDHAAALAALADG